MKYTRDPFNQKIKKILHALVESVIIYQAFLSSYSLQLDSYIHTWKTSTSLRLHQEFSLDVWMEKIPRGTWFARVLAEKRGGQKVWPGKIHFNSFGVSEYGDVIILRNGSLFRLSYIFLGELRRPSLEFRGELDLKHLFS